jgi:hypothetical protein
MVLSETRAHRHGLSLVLVIRGGLWLGECLGETAGQANGSPETHPRTIGSDRTLNLDAVRPHSGSSLVRVLCRLHRQLCWIPELSFLPES